jgi:uncharacterized BrkB/YihY/UPF0761 family membrane protein
MRASLLVYLVLFLVFVFPLPISVVNYMGVNKITHFFQ